MCCLKENGKVFNASSLSTFYRVLIRYLKFRDTDPIDISVDVNFKKVGEIVKAHCLESAKLGQRPGIHSSQSLNPSELKAVMDSGAMSWDNPRGLITLVHYTCMTGMGCRACEECRLIQNEDLVMGLIQKAVQDYLNLLASLKESNKNSPW